MLWGACRDVDLQTQVYSYIKRKVIKIIIIIFGIAAMSQHKSKRRISFPESRDSGPCRLCNRCHRHMSSPSEWRSTNAQQYVLSMKVPLNALVCRPCRDDVTRAACNPAYIPRWSKGSNDSGVICFVKHCPNPMLTRMSIGGSTDSLNFPEQLEFKPNAPFPIPLCKQHYHIVYDALRHTKHCRTCGRRLPQGGNRPCPQPEIIQIHLSQNTDFEGDITEHDRVCQTCYKSHLLVVKESQPISSDRDLGKTLTALKKQEIVVGISNAQDILNAAVNKTLLTVGNMLLENRAMLLPSIHTHFNENAKALQHAHKITESLELTSISSRQILSEVAATFQHHVTYACRV